MTPPSASGTAMTPFGLDVDVLLRAGAVLALDDEVRGAEAAVQVAALDEDVLVDLGGAQRIEDAARARS